MYGFTAGVYTLMRPSVVLDQKLSGLWFESWL